ncbi:hypothetical protein F5B22DRAFT_52001 [Xylaria bambusicola]|uniref:uncharacterized protein n=1 Tax=Xylaria bambusicola TaxID=326684 RepID=UPI0020071FE2|nr:uncharacterized protein F5B22DRAFT_52001 [Xylaria bambusicola]KAI0520798.1 hypothetical protein F5B22DRAFT_52001 [Xylaria bambusicola]
MSELLETARVTLFGSRNAGKNSFEPACDIPSLACKVVLITGAAGDLGRQTAVELARHGRPARIYVADLPRDADAKRGVIERIQHEARSDDGSNDGKYEATDVRFLDLDLTVFESVQKCAAEFLAQEERLDIVVLNAGIISNRVGTTKEGYEKHFGLNYLGHALLLRLLLPLILSTVQQQVDGDARVVVVSSEGHAVAPAGGIQFAKLKTDCADMSYAQRYGQSKLALIGLARELAQRYPSLTTASVHPGRILTGMATALSKESLLVRLTAPLAPLVCVSVVIGIKNHLWAATSPDVVSGKYYEPVGVPDKESNDAKNPDLSRRLWEWTDQELQLAGLL